MSEAFDPTDTQPRALGEPQGQRASDYAEGTFRAYRDENGLIVDHMWYDDRGQRVITRQRYDAMEAMHLGKVVAQWLSDHFGQVAR